MAGLRYLERKTFETADLVITTNQSHRRIAIERGGMAPADVYVVRSGPDLERLTVYPPDPAWRKGKRHLVVYLGEICKQDGVDHLVRAVKLLRDELDRDDVHCVLVGGGPHQPAIKAYAEELGVAERCTFTGRVSDDDLCRILSSADLGVDPDPKNDWSDKSTMNKIMEYMFFGLPIVAYDLTEHRVSAGPAALFAEPNCERALARGISRAARRPGPPPHAWASRPRAGAHGPGLGALGAGAAGRLRPALAGPRRRPGHRPGEATCARPEGPEGDLTAQRHHRAVDRLPAAPAPAHTVMASVVPSVTTSPVAAPPSTSVSECTVSTRRATAMTRTKPPASQGATSRARAVTGATRTASTAVRAAAVAIAT